MFYVAAVKARKVIRRAFRRFAAKTCIRFIPKQAEHTDYIDFVQGVGYVYTFFM